MKKTFVLIFLILIIVAIFSFFKIKTIQIEKNAILNFNSEYEQYDTDKLNGLDITTIINKATSNNEKYSISKDKDGYYILDDENSIEIYVTMIIDGTTYKMERINALGINSFIAYFGQVAFKCTDVKYHDGNGKIASMTFEALEY